MDNFKKRRAALIFGLLLNCVLLDNNHGTLIATGVTHGQLKGTTVPGEKTSPRWEVRRPKATSMAGGWGGNSGDSICTVNFHTNPFYRFFSVSRQLCFLTGPAFAIWMYSNYCFKKKKKRISSLSRKSLFTLYCFLGQRKVTLIS